MKAEDMLRKAAELVGGNRHDQHGERTQNHENIARMWNAYLRAKVRGSDLYELGAADVAIMSALLKIARTASGKHNIDDYMDGAAYLALAGDMAERAGDVNKAYDHLPTIEDLVKEAQAELYGETGGHQEKLSSVTPTSSRRW